MTSGSVHLSSLGRGACLRSNEVLSSTRVFSECKAKGTSMLCHTGRLSQMIILAKGESLLLICGHSCLCE